MNEILSSFSTLALNEGTLITIGVGVVGAIVLLMFILVVLRFALSFYRKVDQGQALIINKLAGKIDVTFTGGVVWPIVYRAEVMDLAVKAIELSRTGSEGLICKDNVRADIKVAFFVRVNPTQQDVLKVAQSIGCTRASKKETLEELFLAKFSEALKTVGKQLNFVELYEEREKFKNRIIEVIGEYLNGYKLEDAAIDYLEQTPIESLREDNILDAQGIKKITDLTSKERILANEIRRNQDKVITQQNVDAREKILELERQQADAELRQKKEIDVIKAREEAEAKIVNEQERLRHENARIQADEELAIANENKDRQVEVARKNKERVVAIETERVAKAQQLEVVDREREVELQRIEKEKALEVERKNIQDVIRQRVAVEKTVAEEEERIKDTRAIMAAERQKKVAVTAATEEAEAKYERDVKEAMAREEAAKHRAQEEITLAQAELAKNEKIAQAKIKLAEGVKAETAAKGLAEVQVREAEADAIQRVGEAEAFALREKGSAEADAKKRMLEAEASGVKEQGLAAATAREAAAVAEEKYGLAEAVAIREKMLGEATGLTEKASAMKALDEASRDHEEFRLDLEKRKEVELAEIEAKRDIVKEQARVMAEAMRSAKIDIVGGDGRFFDSFINAVGGGKSIDAFVGKSEVVQTLGKEYLSGEESLVKDLKEMFAKANVGSEDIKNLSLAALIGKLMANSDDKTRNKLAKLLEAAGEATAKKN